MDHATRQHGVHASCSPKKGATCHARTPKGPCALLTGVGWRSIRWTECVSVVAACQEPQTEAVRRGQASIAFGASYAHLRRIKCVPMPRGAASEVACGALCEVSILWTGSCAPHRPPLPSVPVMPMFAAFNASRSPAGRPLGWPVEGYPK